MNPTDKLKSRGLKKTPIRRELLEILDKSKEALSQNQLETRLSEGYNRVSIYRALIDLENSGLIHKAFDSEGKAKFALCSEACSTYNHNHSHAHFTCTQCNKTICIQPVKHEPVVLNGYIINEVSILAIGTCSECKINM
jgi:Fur family ferric uptake transcriptional regulator